MFKLIELLATLATIASVGNFSILNNALYGILILQIILTIQYIAGVIK